MKRGIRARLIALLATLAVVLPLVGAHQRGYFCTMMGRTVSSCCCGKAPGARDAAARPSPLPALEREDCCRLLPGRASALAPGVREAVVRFHAPLVATLTTLAFADVVFERSSAAGRFVLARPPPPTGPPVYIKHRALLS